MPKGVPSTRRSARRRRQRPPIQLLGQAVTESGGRVLKIRQLTEIDDAFPPSLDELRPQYVLGYNPATPAGRGTGARSR